MGVWNDRIFSSSPLGKSAASVVSKGEHWEPSKLKLPPNYVRNKNPLPTRRFTGPRGCDLTGERFGKLVVLGPSKDVKSTNAKGVAWVVRCDCGAYEHRRTRGLKKVEPARSHCSHCDYLQELKAGNKPKDAEHD